MTALNPASLWLLAMLVVPLAVLAFAVARPGRFGTALLVAAPLPGLVAALLALGGEPMAVTFPVLRLSLALDRPGAILLGAAALLWSLAAIVLPSFLEGDRHARRFVVCWLLTLIGSLGVFAAADLVGFYLVYALVSVPAYGLVAHDETAASDRAGGVYLAFALLGEALLLMGFVLLAAGEPAGSLRIADVMAALPRSPWAGTAVALTAAGFALKMALVPAHGWMPLTYTAAPIPAAAVLSGAAVKAGVIGLIRFLPFDLAGSGEILVVFGLCSAFYGVAVGVTQLNPKTVLAYSSISQMGVLATVLGMGLAAGDVGVRLDAAFYGAHHVLAKGALFLAVGVALSSTAGRSTSFLLLVAIVGLGLGGLPFTGGALAKLAVKDGLGKGPVGMLAVASSVGTSLLMTHFVWTLTRLAETGAERRVPRRLWVAAAAAAIVFPWLLAMILGGEVASLLQPAILFASAWPVALGVVLWLGLVRVRGLLPAVPPGDIVGAMERLFRASYGIADGFAWLDDKLRQWAVAGVALLAVTVALLVAL